MPSASKPSGVKATGSFSWRFHLSLLKLTAIYVAILAVILVLSSSVLYSFFSTRLEHRFHGMRGQPVYTELIPAPPTQEDVQADLVYSLLLVNGVLLIVAGSAGYFLAKLTLEPLKEAYERQRRFLGDASHELRTPLSILKMDLENELADHSLSQKTKARATSNLEEVERMTRLVEDLLVLSRLDEDGITLRHTTSVDLASLTMRLVERLQPLAEKYGITLESKGIDAISPTPIHSQEESLVHIFTNIIKNAIIYNSAGGQVTVTLKKTPKEAQLTVTDTGVGIAKQELDKIFERFYRVDKSRSRQNGGSGLGLAIVKSSVERLGGKIVIRSEVGRGTTVTVALPLK